jgi:signal transduction histidine kinase/CheY-like chemotaxis protein
MDVLALSPEIVEALFPTVLAVDERGRLTRVGPVLARLVPALVRGSELQDHFRARPRADLQAPATWRERAPMLLQSLGDRRFTLRGQSHRVGTETVFFNSLVLRDLSEVQSLDLTLEDLPGHDSTFEFLLSNEQERTSLRAARALEGSLQVALATEARERARLATVVSSLTSGLLMEDGARRVSMANRAFCQLFGIPVEPEQLVGADCAAALAAASVLFADSSGFVRRIEEILSNAEPVTGEELALADGRTFERDYLPLTLSAGTGHLWWYRDVSEDRAVRGALARARERAELQDRRKTSFLAQTSHDLRTPLHVVVGVAELLCREELPPSSKGHVRSLRGNAELLLSLVGEALDVASIEADHFRPDAGPTDPRALADGLLDAFQSRADGKGLALAFDVEPSVPRLLTIDEARVRQIVANLVGNAIKFTPSGRVEVTLSHRDERLRVSVDDTGPGVPREARARIFEPYVQVEGTHERFGGTGLGLSIVRDLVSRLGGEALVEDGPLSGARFVIELPAPTLANDWPSTSLRVWMPSTVHRSVRHAVQTLGVEVTDARATASVAIVNPDEITGVGRELVLGRDLEHPIRFRELRACLFEARSSPRPTSLGRVLVVEDDVDAAMLLVRRLEHEGWSAVHVSDGREALDRLARESFDAVVSDLHMPGADGIELARRWRAQERGRRLPMFVVTTHAMAGVRDACIAAGFDHFFAKPIDFPRLTLALRRSVAPTVLVVDDDATSVDVTSRLVTELGSVELGPMEVVSASTAHEVREIVATRRVDVALVDVGLGDVDGREVGAWLRARHVAVVWVTGDTSVELDGDVVLKPVRRARLAAALEAALGSSEKRESLPREPLVALEIDELVAELLPEFLARAEERTAQARVASIAEELAVAQRLGHDLKGTSASYGVPQLGALGADLESASKRGDVQAARVTLEALARALGELRSRVGG